MKEKEETLAEAMDGSAGSAVFLIGFIIIFIFIIAITW